MASTKSFGLPAARQLRHPMQGDLHKQRSLLGRNLAQQQRADAEGPPYQTAAERHTAPGSALRTPGRLPSSCWLLQPHEVLPAAPRSSLRARKTTRYYTHTRSGSCKAFNARLRMLYTHVCPSGRNSVHATQHVVQLTAAVTVGRPGAHGRCGSCWCCRERGGRRRSAGPWP